MSRRVLLLFVIASALPSIGCGYRLGFANSAPAGVRRVMIPAFVNLSYEPGVEHAFTQAARAELSRRGLVEVVREGHDAILEGRVTHFTIAPAGFAPQPAGGGKQVPTRYRVNAGVHVSLVVPKTGEVIWSTGVRSTSSFDETGALGFEAMARKVRQNDAAAEIASQVMREAFDRMLADF